MPLDKLSCKGHVSVCCSITLLLVWERFIPCVKRTLFLRSYFTAAPDICSRYSQVWYQFLVHIYLANFVSTSPYSFASPSDNNFSVRRSTAEMLKSQTDWLKTFQQEMSTFNRLTVKSRPSSLTASNSRNLTTLYPLKSHAIL